MQKKTWLDELEQSRVDIDADAELIAEDIYEDEGPLAGFEHAAEHAYDKEFLKEDADKADWFED